MTPSETPGARRDERTSSGAAATATAERSAQVSRDLRASQLERRPANTSKSYGTSAGPGTRWIKQFREFVAAAPGSTLYGNRIDPDREAYDGGDDLVTPDKCLEFLRFTAGAKARLVRQTYRRGPGTASRSTTSLARSHYGVAIVLSNHAKDTARRKRQKYLCRHTRALLVGYNDEQHGMLCEYALFDGAPGPTERNKLFRGTRARFAHVVQHVLALRGDSLRKAQLADWLVFQTRCLHFSMALYLFTMWTVLGPIVVREWMDYFLVFDGKPAGRRGKSGPPDPKNPLSDKAMLDETKGMYARIAALRMAEAAGVGRDELRQAAHHRQADALSVSYCNDFPMRFIRHSAGFPIDGGCYYVARSLEPVPDRLRNMVFGSVVDPVRAMMRSDEATFDRNTRNHLDMLDHLAECLVQDAALMRKLGKMDDHPMWGFAPFNTKEFADYVERQDAAMKNMPIERLRMTAAAAQERGDTLTAAAINAIYASLCDTHHKVAAAAVPSTTTAVRLANTPARQLSEIHSRVCDAQSPTTVRVTQEVAQEYFRGVDGARRSRSSSASTVKKAARGEDAGVAFLDGLIKDQFPHSRRVSHLVWLQKELSKRRPNYAKNRARGKGP
ncbi:hypothetical protein CTAYLR_008962 [Chrysophaeum taylorii]|uniref:Ndc10 domain-containing protein n=1 Tax=Chrysophaeum taylorii TaxID=2483200 RepID=A0AAD7UJ98_9STRA|nr:hypothetical protein CTAYLR_008962 [Chrysophaeum taylorii]